MNFHELYEFLNEHNPVWNDSGELVAAIEISESSIELITNEYGVTIEKLRIQGGNRRYKGFHQPSSLTSDTYGKVVDCYIKTTNNSVGAIYKTIECLAKAAPVSPPDKFIIFNHKDDHNYYDSEEEELVLEGKVKHYIEIAQFWSSLQENAEDYSDKSLTFLYRKKLKLSANYNVDLLKQEYGSLSRFQRILDVLAEDSHKDAKPHILQNALVNVLYHVAEEDRFGYLLKHFEQFTTKFDDGYHAYVVGFSFDDLRKEYEERYREYMVKINDLISSSLTKALMIPGVLYLTATRTQAIQTSKGLSNGLEALVVNMGIGIAAITVFMIYWCILCNERKSLGSIKDEFESLMGRLEEKSPHAVPQIEKFKHHIEDRLSNGRTYIWILIRCNLAALLFACIWIGVRTIPN
ncbi:hypothetical protein F0267_22170 [Vibrio coralliilyticus]|uniref:Uncharacterized protein n=1 Tax=Vibrio coralliilyticus TaxID=190893 RepID=A0AAN0SEX0_9VIBR|nr:hypothetical protein [Vibrio coralliilyticus]AIW21329.1 hypothetical protein IX92_20130 [Vibrio coralliilyticus]NOH40934.1 hypothetical protein [Vibrio coralliilyticus]